MECSYSSAERGLDDTKHLHWKRGQWYRNYSIKKLEKEQNKSKASRNSEIVNKKTEHQLNQKLVLKKMNTIDKPLTKLTKKREDKPPVTGTGDTTVALKE